MYISDNWPMLYLLRALLEAGAAHPAYIHIHVYVHINVYNVI